MKSYKYLIKIGNKLLWKQISRELLIWRAAPVVERLGKDLPEGLRPLSTALATTLSGTPDPKELPWIEAIEKLRFQLFEDEESVFIHDFGAGNFYENTTRRDAPGLQSRPINLTCWLSAKPPFWCFFLMNLVRRFQSQRCLELGTNLGVSTAYLAAAQLLNGAGSLVTIEGAEAFARKAGDHLTRFGLSKKTTSIVGPFSEKLPQALSTGYDFVFIDGHHVGSAMLKYYRMIRPHLKAPAIVVFDDISWSCDMRRAWNIIERDPDFEVCLNLLTLGVCVFNPDAQKRIRLTIPLI